MRKVTKATEPIAVISTNAKPAGTIVMTTPRATTQKDRTVARATKDSKVMASRALISTNANLEQIVVIAMRNARTRLVPTGARVTMVTKGMGSSVRISTNAMSGHMIVTRTRLAGTRTDLSSALAITVSVAMEHIALTVAVKSNVLPSPRVISHPMGRRHVAATAGDS